MSSVAPIWELSALTDLWEGYHYNSVVMGLQSASQPASSWPATQPAIRPGCTMSTALGIAHFAFHSRHFGPH